MKTQLGIKNNIKTRIQQNNNNKHAQRTTTTQAVVSKQRAVTPLLHARIDHNKATATRSAAIKRRKATGKRNPNDQAKKAIAISKRLALMPKHGIPINPTHLPGSQVGVYVLPAGPEQKRLRSAAWDGSSGATSSAQNNIVAFPLRSLVTGARPFIYFFRGICSRAPSTRSHNGPIMRHRGNAFIYFVPPRPIGFT